MYNKEGEHVTKNSVRDPSRISAAPLSEEWYRQMSTNMGPITLKIDKPSGGGLSECGTGPMVRSSGILIRRQQTRLIQIWSLPHAYRRAVAR
jgi:hypothetical protein